MVSMAMLTVNTTAPDRHPPGDGGKAHAVRVAQQHEAAAWQSTSPSIKPTQADVHDPIVRSNCRTRPTYTSELRREGCHLETSIADRAALGPGQREGDAAARHAVISAACEQQAQLL